MPGGYDGQRSRALEGRNLRFGGPGPLSSAVPRRTSVTKRWTTTAASGCARLAPAGPARVEVRGSRRPRRPLRRTAAGPGPLHAGPRRRAAAPGLVLTVLGLLAVLGCSQNTERIPRGSEPPPPPRPLATQGSSGETERDRLGRGTPPGVTGEIRLAPDLAGRVSADAVLFVFARTPGGGPIAAKRLGHPAFPVRFFLGQESAMFEGQGLEGQVDLEARISQSGAAGPPEPGDLLGRSPDNPVSIGDTQVHDIIIDTVQ